MKGPIFSVTPEASIQNKQDQTSNLKSVVSDVCTFALQFDVLPILLFEAVFNIV